MTSKLDIGATFLGVSPKYRKVYYQTEKVMQTPAKGMPDTEIVISEKVKVHREDLVKKMIKDIYKDCKEKIRNEGTIVGASCICKKLVDKEWQRAFITSNILRKD